VRHGKIFSENLRPGARHAPPTRARPKLAKTDSGTRAMQRKQAMQKCATSKKKMRPPGFEPSTSALTRRCANRLS